MRRLLTAILIPLLAVASFTAALGQSLDPIILDPLAPPKKTDGGVAKPVNAAAQEAPKPPARPAPQPQPTVKPKRFEIDKDARRLTVFGRFAGAAGILDLGACTGSGRKYVSALILDTGPAEIAEAMTSLDFQTGQVPVVDLKAGTTTAPQGPQVDIFVEWATLVGKQESPRRVRLEQLFWHRATDKVLGDAPWIYTGGKRVRADAGGDEILSAELSGSIAALTRDDTSALFYYGGDAPTTWRWQANPENRPPAGTPCRLVIEPVLPPKVEQPAEPAAPATPSPEKAPQPAGTPEPQPKPPAPPAAVAPPTPAPSAPSDTPIAPLPLSPGDSSQSTFGASDGR